MITKFNSFINESSDWLSDLRNRLKSEGKFNLVDRIEDEFIHLIDSGFSIRITPCIVSDSTKRVSKKAQIVGEKCYPGYHIYINSNLKSIRGSDINQSIRRIEEIKSHMESIRSSMQLSCKRLNLSIVNSTYIKFSEDGIVGMVYLRDQFRIPPDYVEHRNRVPLLSIIDIIEKKLKTVTAFTFTSSRKTNNKGEYMEASIERSGDHPNTNIRMILTNILGRINGITYTIEEVNNNNYKLIIYY